MICGGTISPAGRVGAYCIRPIKWPRRGQIRRRRLTPICPRHVFRLRRIPVGRYCSRPGTSGAYAIRPYTDVRQWPLSFIRPRNVFQWERLTLGRPCRSVQQERLALRHPQNGFQRGVFLLRRPQNGFQRGVFLLRHPQNGFQRGVFLLRRPICAFF